MKYEIHELAALFPKSDRVTVKHMAEDIKKQGQLERGILLDGKLFDGRTRQEACEIAGVEFKTETYAEYLARTGQPADKNPREVVFALNLHRRHLTDSQRASLAAKMVETNHGGDRKVKGSNAPLTQDQAAKAANVKKSAVKRASVIKKRGIKPIQALVEEGQLNISVAEKAAKLPEAVQKEAVKEGAAGVKAAVQKANTKPKKSKTVKEFRARLVVALEAARDGSNAKESAYVDLTPKQVVNKCIKIVEDME